MKKLIAIGLAAICLAGLSGDVSAESSVTRIKDIAKIQGVRSNQLMGYGLVVGLNKTGDSDKSPEMIQSTLSLLRNYGITVADIDDLDPKNIAAVMVTATLPPFVREGDTIDITVSSLGDAKSIQGGTLLQTPLKAANGETYAVAQGPISTGGFTAGNGGGSGSTATKNFPTVGTCPNGAIVERSVEDDDIGEGGRLSLSLARADFTTSARVANAINAQYGAGIAKAANPGRVDISVPSYFRGNVVEFVASIEELYVMPDNVARVVVNERTGTIIMGGNVTVDECSITQGGLTISIKKTNEVDQPAPFSFGSTIETSNTETEVQESSGNTIVLPATANISDIVGALNAVGATPRDTISILQAMKAAGAIHATLELV